MPEGGLVAYSDALKVLDRALESKHGIVIFFKHKARAQGFRFRLYAARRADRKHNRLIFEPSDPSWGSSAYDELVLTIHEDEGWRLYLTRGGLGPNLGIDKIVDLDTGEKLDLEDKE